MSKVFVVEICGDFEETFERGMGFASDILLNAAGEVVAYGGWSIKIQSDEVKSEEHNAAQ